MLKRKGQIDVLPNITGFSELWGRNVIRCPFWHGFENADRQWGVLAKNIDDIESAAHCLHWTQHVRVFAPTEVDVPPAVERRLREQSIQLERHAITELVLREGELFALRLRDGELIPCGTLVHQPPQTQAPLVSELGLNLDAQGRVIVDDCQRTSVCGIFAAGDLTQGSQTVSVAVAAGAKAAMNISRALARFHQDVFLKRLTRSARAVATGALRPASGKNRRRPVQPPP